MPTVAPSRARSEAMARAAASSSGTTSAAGAAPEALGAAGGPGRTSGEKSATAHPSASGRPVRRMTGGISKKPLSRLRRAGWEAIVAALFVGSEAVGAAVLAGCSVHPGGSAALRDGPIEMLVASDPETLDPRYVTDAVGHARHAPRARGARAARPRHARAPALPRASWRWLDPLTLEIALRDDVRFHSGAPLDPRDVVATLRAFASPGGGVAPRERRRGHRRGATRTAITGWSSASRGPTRRCSPTSSCPSSAPTRPRRLRRPTARSTGSARTRRPRVARRGAARARRRRRPPRARPTRSTLRTVHDENARALRLEAGAPTSP